MRKLYKKWRKETPSTYNVDIYGRRPQMGAKKIDWERFKSVRPKEYERISAEVERLGVTWEQAMKDKKIRTEISLKAGYWY